MDYWDDIFVVLIGIINLFNKNVKLLKNSRIYVWLVEKISEVSPGIFLNNEDNFILMNFNFHIDKIKQKIESKKRIIKTICLR